MDRATLSISLQDLQAQFATRSVAGDRWPKARRNGDRTRLRAFARAIWERNGMKVALMRKLAAIGMIAILGCIPLISSEAMGQDKFQRLTGSQIRARIAGMQIADETHWRYVYERNGTLRTQAMGRTNAGRWSIQKDELCLDLGDSPDGGCFEVWLAGRNVEMKPTGNGLPLEGVIEQATDRK
jgi:hypothetical protein